MICVCVEGDISSVDLLVTSTVNSRISLNKVQLCVEGDISSADLLGSSTVNIRIFLLLSC